MQVNPLYSANTPLGKSKEAESSAEKGHVLENEHSSTSESPHAHSSELLELLRQLEQVPAVRDDRAREVAQLLQTGYYLTPEVALKTAEVFLGQS